MIDTATTKIYCKECNRRLFSEQGYTTRYNKDNEVDHHLCTPCVKNLRIKEYNESGGEITTQLWLDATMRDSWDGAYHRLRESVADFYRANEDILKKVFSDMEEVTVVMKEFEKNQWFGWVQDYYNSTDIRGHSYKGDDFKVLLWGCAGRVLITLQGDPNSKYKGANITMIFDEDSKDPRGGIQGIYATKEQALDLIRAGMRMPKNSFQPDNEVTII